MSDQRHHSSGPTYKILVAVEESDELIRALRRRASTSGIAVDISQETVGFPHETDPRRTRLLRGIRNLTENVVGDVLGDRSSEAIRYAERGIINPDVVAFELNESVISFLEGEGLVVDVTKAEWVYERAETPTFSSEEAPGTARGFDVIRETEKPVEAAPEPADPFASEASVYWRPARYLAIGGLAGVGSTFGILSIASQGMVWGHAVGALALVLLLVGVDRMVALAEMLLRDRAVQKDAKGTAQRIARMEI